jgi:hypothetical protein
VTRAHLAHSTYHGPKKARGQTENKGSAIQEVLSTPTFLGAKLTCLQESYRGINGRRKKLIVVFIYNIYQYISRKLSISEALKSTHCDFT